MNSPLKEQRLSDSGNTDHAKGKDDAKKARAAKPGWVHGLRQLYDSTLNEPLPPSFEELLRKLDQGGDSAP